MRAIKQAFTLIEVLFAIIIIAISVTSVPFIIQQTQRSTDFSIAQESLLAATTKLYSIYSYRWDEQSSDDPESPRYVKVVKTNGAPALNVTLAADGNETGLRIGHIRQDGRNKFFTTSEHNASLFATFGDTADGDAIIDDIDDFHNTTSTIDTLATGSVDYKRDLLMNTRVIYISDTADYSQSNVNFDFNLSAVANTTNIKMIEVNSTATIVDENITFTLKGFVSNLGESSLYYRTK